MRSRGRPAPPSTARHPIFLHLKAPVERVHRGPQPGRHGVGEQGRVVCAAPGDEQAGGGQNSSCCRHARRRAHARRANHPPLLHQATVGDVTGDRPGMLSFEARAKYDAWAKLAGMSKAEAMQVGRRKRGGRGAAPKRGATPTPPHPTLPCRPTSTSWATRRCGRRTVSSPSTTRRPFRSRKGRWGREGRPRV